MDMLLLVRQVHKMGRGFGSPILPLTELCLLILIAQNVHAYPYQADGIEDADQFLDTVKESQTTVNFVGPFPEISRKFGTDRARRNEPGILVGEPFEDDEPREPEERFDNNGRLNGRVRRGAPDTPTKTLGRGFTGHSIEDTENAQLDGKIVFPEDFDRVPVCKGSTYCEKVDSYPENIVTNAIQQNESLRYLAGVDVVSDIAQRIDVMDDVPLCVSSEQVIFPQTAENKDNQWKYIANQENFKQGVRIEKCNKENTRCSVIGGPGEGYKTSCRQKYVYRQLAAVLSDGTVIPDTFKFPSSCCCHVTFIGSPLTRLGVTSIGEERSHATPAKTRRRK
ncbi:PREDICTED: uncharacterized protein LOC107185720 [Dufourea novaeangliae]|nr:PREDICTED: uncharacterized protein LOC107185720 [Dufourea novaeangliae]